MPERFIDSVPIETTEIRNHFLRMPHYELARWAIDATAAFRELAAHKAEAKQMAHTDELTEVLSRRGLKEAYEANKDRRRRQVDAGKTDLVAFIDVDDFGKVNEHHGHHIGDVVLKEIGKSIKGSVRETDAIGRFGGDEFVGLFSVNNLSEGANIASKLQTSVEQGMEAIARDLHYKLPTLTIGIAEIDPTLEFEDVCTSAIGAYRKAKSQGPRGQVYIASGRHNE